MKGYGDSTSWNPTFAEAAFLYMSHVDRDREYLLPIIRFFGADVCVDEISDVVVSRAALVLSHGRKRSTVKRVVITPIRAVLNFVSGRRPVRSDDTPRTRWLLPEELEQLLTACSQLRLPRHKAPERFTLQKVAFLIGTGCRASECFAADVDDWNPVTRQWFLSGNVPGAAKTATSRRWVRLPSRCIDLIGELPVEGRAFLTPYGKPIVVKTKRGGQMQTSFNRARDMAGLGADVTPHVLRHTWATWFYAQNRDFGALMDLGGWATADQANRYRKLAPDDLGDRLLDFGWDFRIRRGHNLADVRLHS